MYFSLLVSSAMVDVVEYLEMMGESDSVYMSNWCL